MSVLAIMGVIKLSYVVFRRPTNRKQLSRYLNKLSKESSFIQLFYSLYRISARHGLAELVNEVMMKLLRSSAQGLGADRRQDLPHIP